MRRELIIGLATGIGALAALTFVVLFINKGSHVILEGAVQKVRTQDLDGACAVIVDFRVTNPADHPFVVRKIDVIVELDGQKSEGAVVADVDAKRLFDYYPALGPKFNETLKSRDKVLPRQTVDRMVMARFETPEARMQARKGLIVRIEEVDGVVSEVK